LKEKLSREKQWQRPFLDGVREDDDFTKGEGGIRFAARWKDQERWMMLTVLENEPGEVKAKLSKGSAPLL